MALTYSETRSGLVVGREAADERSVRSALKAIDDHLLLDFTGECYQVLKRVSSEGHVRRVCSWRDDAGRPLPLSHGLVDRVDSLRVDGRVPAVDVEAENQKLQDAQAAEADELLAWYAKEAKPRLRGTRSSNLPRGTHRRQVIFPDGIK